MFARTSDRGEPAKINFCRLRTDSVENSPNSCSGALSLDRTFGGNCIALSMKRSSCPYWIRLAEFCYQHDGKKDGAGEKLDDLLPFPREVGVHPIASRVHSADFKRPRTLL